MLGPGRAATPDDLGATVYHALGLDTASQFVDAEGRPQRLNNGQVIEALTNMGGVLRA